MTLIAGIDFSTKQITAAIIPLDPTVTPHVTFTHLDLPRTRDTTQRLRGLRRGMALTFWTVELAGRAQDVTSVWVEEPWGPHRNVDRSLLPLYGGILASVPTTITATGITTRDWRTTLGLRLSGSEKKLAAIAHANLYLHQQAGWDTNESADVTEHECEALCIALAGRTITWAHHEKGTP
jgi:hypothetical protein